MDQGPKCQTSNKTKASQYWIWQWFFGYDTKSTGNNDINKHRQTGLCENYSFVHQKGFAGGTSGKEPTCQCRRHKRSGLERYSGGGHGNPFQYSCLENPMDRGAWWATVHGVTKSWTQMSNLACKHVHQKTVQRIKRPSTEYERISAIIYIIRY